MFQEAFKVAVSSWLEMGIYQKMRKEVTTSIAFRGFFGEAFWTPENVPGNKQLTMQHFIPVFIMAGLGLVPAIMVFFMELMHKQYKNRVANMVSVSSGSPGHISRSTDLRVIR